MLVFPLPTEEVVGAAVLLMWLLLLLLELRKLFDNIRFDDEDDCEPGLGW